MALSICQIQGSHIIYCLCEDPLELEEGVNWMGCHKSRCKPGHPGRQDRTLLPRGPSLSSFEGPMCTGNVVELYLLIALINLSVFSPWNNPLVPPWFIRFQ